MRAQHVLAPAVAVILAVAAWQQWFLAAPQVVVNAPPRHIALIPDGNRRWARSRGLSVAEGHRAGMTALGPAAAAAWDGGVEVVTFWWGSPANLLKRDADEVANIIGVLAEWLPKDGVALLQKYSAELEFGGRWRELAPALIPAVDSAQQALATSHGGSPRVRKLLVLIGYDGQEEILAAAAKVGGNGAAVDRAAFEGALWTANAPPVDLIVRSAAAGEPHLSAGFMLWHIANAQLSWLPDYWPAVRPSHIQKAIDAFRGTQRRMGK
jgi:undecaprenyl diphosphate synthase